MKTTLDFIFLALIVAITSWFTEDIPDIEEEKANYMIDYDLKQAENRSKLLESSSLVKDAYLERHLDSIKRLNYN